MPRNNETAAIAHSTAIGQVIERLLIPGLIPELTMRSSNKFKNQQFIGSESSKRYYVSYTVSWKVTYEKVSKQRTSDETVVDKEKLPGE